MTSQGVSCTVGRRQRAAANANTERDTEGATPEGVEWECDTGWLYLLLEVNEHPSMRTHINTGKERRSVIMSQIYIRWERRSRMSRRGARDGMQSLLAGKCSGEYSAHAICVIVAHTRAQGPIGGGGRDKGCGGKWYRSCTWVNDSGEVVDKATCYNCYYYYSVQGRRRGMSEGVQVECF